ncbi:DNA alkylation repair protein [Candidatus Pacearchaeota archaeon]|nr:DNA alkylation repair protein [Candidatus Pacearchaeota archaeon]
MGTFKIDLELEREKNPEHAKILQRFFKTGPGEYGEGDVFFGIKVPVVRKIAKGFIDLDIFDVEKLLKSKVHEKRLVGILILIEKYKSFDESGKKQIFEFYLNNSKYVNNWDLVDLSCPHIVGNYLLDKNRDILYELSKSDNLWERRISIVSTFSFIRNNEFLDTLKICELLLKDKHDLMHKACGWMLREVGKRNQTVLEDFLKKHYKVMPRTMLRYAIERFPEELRLKYLKGLI